MDEREQIKQNLRKVNCFVNHEEPEFISSMSRTMDAFDIRMQTFGGNQKAQKAKYQDKFMSEKRGFIRTINGYSDSNPHSALKEGSLTTKVLNREFITNFDNRYKETTSFATSDGRFKQALDTNKQTDEDLKSAQRVT